MHFIVCVAFTLIASTVWPPSPNSPTVPEIIGTVLDFKGKPMAGVPVSILAIPSNQIMQRGISEATGKFEFAGLPPGAYGVTASTRSACAFSSAINVSTDYTTLVSLRLIKGMCNGSALH
jgi:hypothetical protein